MSICASGLKENGQIRVIGTALARVDWRIAAQIPNTASELQDSINRRRGDGTSTSTMVTTLAQRRADAKACLDCESDFVVVGVDVRFRQSFRAVEADETFCHTPESIVNSVKRLFELDIGNGISSLVHDTVVVKIGCNNVPLFAMVSGGRGHTVLIQVRLHGVHRVHGHPCPATRGRHQVDRHGRFTQP